MLKILGRANSANVQKVVWTLVELGQAFERTDVGGKFGGNKEADYLAMNPNGVIPTLIDGATVVWESNTILRYLANCFGATPLYPEGATARANVERWMDWQLSTFSPAITRVFWALVRMPLNERNPEVIEQDRLRCQAALTLLDGAIGEGPFICGANLTLADIALAPQVYRWFELPIQRDDLPQLSHWYEQVKKRPGFVEHVALGLT